MALETIVWLDACTQENVSKNKLNLIEKSNSDGTGFLSRNKTHGKVYKVYKEVLVLVQDETEDEENIEIYSIPRSCIISPKKYRKK